LAIDLSVTQGIWPYALCHDRSPHSNIQIGLGQSGGIVGNIVVVAKKVLYAALAPV
jgi:hypothetical protein